MFSLCSFTTINFFYNIKFPWGLNPTQKKINILVIKKVINIKFNEILNLGNSDLYGNWTDWLICVRGTILLFQFKNVFKFYYHLHWIVLIVVHEHTLNQIILYWSCTYFQHHQKTQIVVFASHLLPLPLVILLQHQNDSQLYFHHWK